MDARGPWWHRTTVYHLYPRSFKDASGDGIGDLRGVLDELDYLHDLGVETLWLSPFFASPQTDHGYDITDHLQIAPEYGSEEDLTRLFDAIHARGIKIVLDLVLNHTSIEHEWFREARSSRENPLRDYYLWRDGRGARPPNNWRSALGASGWHHDAQTDQWYYASFLPFQPDLNYRNPELKARMLDVVRTWLARGADGLRLDLFHALFKDAAFRDNPRALRPVPSDDDLTGFFQRPVHTFNHPDTLAFARELRAVVDEFDDPPRFVVGEVFGDLPTLRAYCEGEDGLHTVFLFKAITTPFTAPAFRALMREFEQYFPPPLQPTWVFGNHDRPRLIDRLDRDADKAKLLAALQLTARGVPVIYYGDELGLHHHELPMEGALDPIATRFRFVPRFLHGPLRMRGILLNRDSARSPMPWSAEPHAGFSAATTDRTWLPIHPSHAELNVAAQRTRPDSQLACYRRLLHLRRASPALSDGQLELTCGLADPRSVLSYRRVARDEVAHVFLNFTRRTQNVRLPEGLVTLRSNRQDAPVEPGESRLAPYEAWVGFTRGESRTAELR